MHNNWSENSKIIGRRYSSYLVYLMLRCRPFYLYRDFTVTIIMAVYILPQARLALGELLPAITQQQNKYPEGVFMIAGEFNQVNLKTVLPKFHQYVNFPTRGENTLDHVYSNMTDAYKASPSPNLGQSDHISLFLTPGYRPPINRVRPSIRTLQIWPRGALSYLQDSFECTE